MGRNRLLNCSVRSRRMVWHVPINSGEIGDVETMRQSHAVELFAACSLLLAGAEGVLGQGRINTSIETAQKVARQTGRPILAIAGKKT